jgi:NADH-quinone oxidoreductase subunit J
MELALFFVLAAVVVLSSLAVVLNPSPMHSVLLLIVTFVGLAALYIQLDSPFAAVTQIIVYAGAIIVLFLFVVMLLNAPREDAPSPYGPSYVTLTAGPRKIFTVLTVILLAELAWALRGLGVRAIPGDPQTRDHVMSVRNIGIALFTDHAFAFEVTSVLILVAMVGAVVLAKKKI